MGRKVKDLVNQQFGRLTVMYRDTDRPNGQGRGVYWVCQCKCGNTKSIRTDKLTKGITKSCGCLSKEVRTQLFLKDLTGQQFGKLIVIGRDLTKPMGSGKFAYWNCTCSCGNVTSVRGDHLRDGTTVGCGCTSSRGEEKIAKILREAGVNFKQQYSFDNLRVQKPLRFDFAVFNNEGELQYLIEFQGLQHYKCKEGTWDNQQRFEKRLEYDKLKREYCVEHNIVLIEIPYTDYDILSLEYINNRK